MAHPDLNLLIALDVLLDEGSVVAAARRMNLSAPAMSRTLGRIRQTLGDPILVAAGRKMVPTPKALALREQVRSTVQAATSLLVPSEQVDLTHLTRRFNVRAHDVFLALYASQLSTMLAREMPKALLCFTPEEDDVDVEVLRSGRVDLFISADRELGPEICVQPLFTTDILGVVRQGHPLLEQRVTPQILVQWRHVSISRRGKTAGPIDQKLAESGLQRDLAVVAPTSFAGLSSIVNSDMILALPRHIAQSAVASGLKISCFPWPFALEPVTVTQAWHPRFQNDPAHQWQR